MGFLQISHAVKYQLTGASERVVILIRLLGSIVKHGTFLKTLGNFYNLLLLNSTMENENNFSNS